MDKDPMRVTTRNAQVGACSTPAGQAELDMSIVLVCWNNKGYLSACLQSLYAEPMHSRFDVVVVDNGSTDGSQLMLREQFPQVQLIQNAHNVGLGKASNQGIVATTGRYILLLNNDTLVNGASLDALVAFLDATPAAGAAGGRLLNPDGSLQAGTNNFPSLHEEFFIATRLGEWLWAGYPSHHGANQVTPTEWLGSACLLLRRAALDQIGLLDEEYFIYGDEADVQYRLKKAGWAIYYLPTVYTIHYGGRSLDRWRRRQMVYRGKLLFFKKNYGPLRTSLLRILFGSLSMLKLIIWTGMVVFPQWRELARKELRSNFDIVRLCWQLA